MPQFQVTIARPFMDYQYRTVSVAASNAAEAEERALQRTEEDGFWSDATVTAQCGRSYGPEISDTKEVL